jgi:hypothetical protein
MDGPETSPESQRFLLTLELMEAGFEMARQRFRRQHPEATASEIDALYREWLQAPGEIPPEWRERPLSSLSSA